MSKIGVDFDFIGKKKIFFTISLSIMAIGLFFNIFFGVKMDTEFKGGTLIKYSFQGSMNEDSVKSFVKDTIGKEMEADITTNTDQSTVLTLTMTEPMSMEEQKTLNSSMNTKYSENHINQITMNTLSPTMGSLFFIKCIVAIALSSLFLVIYVAIRFRKIGGWSAGAMALVALLHDCLIAYFTFVIFQIPLNENFVAVVLSILGYSLNDTIVIYDRIRENRKKMESNTPIGDIVNLSINQSFTRSFNTGLCTFIAIGTVAVMSLIYGLDEIVSFAVPMMFGVISGCYSTVCICGPLWVSWRNHVAKKEIEKKSNVKKIKA